MERKMSDFLLDGFTVVSFVAFMVAGFNNIPPMAVICLLLFLGLLIFRA